MSNMFDQLIGKATEQSKAGGNSGDIIDVRDKLKHEQLLFDKDNGRFFFRILPPVDETKFISEAFKEIWVNTISPNGKKVNLRLVLPLDATPESSVAMAKIAEWQANNVEFATFPNPKFATKYVLNVIQYKQVNNQLVAETDAQGNPIVRIITLPMTAHRALLTKMGEEERMFNTPPNAGGLGGVFASENDAFLVGVNRTGKGLDTKYDVNVYQQPLGPLGPLPSNWKDLAEDLSYQVTPTEQLNPEFMQNVFDMVDGVTRPSTGTTGATLSQTTTDDINNSLDSMFGGTTQPPVQPTQAPQTPPQTFQQPVTQTPTAPVQTPPQAPVQPTQPAQATQPKQDNEFQDIDDLLGGLV